MNTNNEASEHSVSDELLDALADEFYGRGPKAVQREAQRKAEDQARRAEELAARKAFKDGLRRAIKQAIERGLIPGSPNDYGVGVKWYGSHPNGIRITTRCAPLVAIGDWRDREDFAMQACAITDRIEAGIKSSLDPSIAEVAQALFVKGTGSRSTEGQQ
jgi:hypothetical protein